MNFVLFMRAQCSLSRQLGPNLGSAENIHVNIELSCDCMKVIQNLVVLLNRKSKIVVLKEIFINYYFC